MQSRHKHRIFDASKTSESSTEPSNTFINLGLISSIIKPKLLHSKSTYFYQDGNVKPAQTIKSSFLDPAFSQPVVTGASRLFLARSAADGLRKDFLWSGKRNMLALCILALSVGLGINLLSYNQAYADSLSLSFTTNPDNTGATNVTKRDEVQYREYAFNVNYGDLKGNTYYHISVSAEDAHDGQLFNEEFPSFQISGVGSNVKPGASFRDNSWGYNLTKESTAKEDLNYSTVPTANSNPEAATYRTSKDGNNSGSDPFRLNFAAKFGDDAPDGNYRTNVYLSVVMDPSSSAFDGAKTMQEMTNDACKNTDEGVSEQLEDTRINADGKTRKYWVTKLKDGNCWMTQNLDYDIKAGDFAGAKATKTGDVNSGWSSTQTEIQSWDPEWSSEGTKTYYYNYETVTDGTAWHNCGSGLANMSTCIDGIHWSETAPAEGEHYRVGNFYSWNAATAGTGGSMTNGEASASICPAGWKLPTSNNTAKGSFAYLLTDKANGYGLESNADGSNKIRQAPLYFIPAGYVNNGGFNLAGNYGFCWSSTPVSNGTDAYYLYFSSGNVNPSLSSGRYFGRSVRCVYVPTETTYTVNYDMNLSGIGYSNATDDSKNTFASEAATQTNTTGTFTTPATISEIDTMPVCHFAFSGWATTSNGSVEYGSGVQFNVSQPNTTLYAKWVRKGGICAS